MIVRQRLLKQLLSQKKRIRKTKTVAKYCCFVGCSVKSTNSKGFTIIPKLQCKLPSNASLARLKTFQKKTKLREEILLRCGLKKSDARKDLRYCVLHKSNECKTFYDTITYNDETIKNTYTLHNLPSAKGISICNPSKTLSKGVGKDRLALNMINDITNNTVAKDEASWKVLAQQTFEQITPHNNIEMNQSVAAALGIENTLPKKRNRHTYSSSKANTNIYKKQWEESLKFNYLHLTMYQHKCHLNLGGQ